MTKQRHSNLRAVMALLIISLGVIPFAIATPEEAPTCREGQPITSNNYDALLWYRNSAERKALYRQIFNDALDQIEYTVTEDKLKSKTWGVIFGLDGTLLDISGNYLNNTNRCIGGDPETKNQFIIESAVSATAGAKEITCGIQKLGGYVVIVSDVVGSGENGMILQQQTKANLSRLKICYDNILFTNNQYDTDKNIRFTAVNAGDYENVISSRKLPPIKVIAYLGSNIEDIPNFKQATAKNLPADSPELEDFGDRYFLLPNPLFGVWQNNRLK